MSQLQLHEIMAAIKQKLYLKTQPWLLNISNPVSCFACKGFNFVISYFYHRISFLRWNQKLNASSPSLLFVIQAVLPTLDTRNLFILRSRRYTARRLCFPLCPCWCAKPNQTLTLGLTPSLSPNLLRLIWTAGPNISAICSRGGAAAWIWRSVGAA